MNIQNRLIKWGVLLTLIILWAAVTALIPLVWAGEAGFTTERRESQRIYASTTLLDPAPSASAKVKSADLCSVEDPDALRALLADSHPLTDPIVVDGVFTGVLIDGDGTATAGIGSAHPTKFIEQKKFDPVDRVYYQELDGTTGASAGDAYWIDDGDGTFEGSPADAVIAGAPADGTAGTRVDALAGETAIAYNDAEINDNNRYDDGEDIYLVDSAGEFRGAMQRVISDPFRPGQTLAHIYIANNADTMFMHNDFIVDAESVWIDGDGTTTAGPGAQSAIGFQPFTNTISSTLSVQFFGRWFTTDDNVYWKSTGTYTDTWSSFGDALWLDAGDDGTYNAGSDSIIVDTGTLQDGDTGRELNSDSRTPTYNFTYNDANGNGRWDDGEAIGTLDGDEIHDWNYFDDRWSWLVDGDGDATDRRGTEDETRIDGNTWFQAGDNVRHWDADANGDWNAGDGLWIDDDGNGLFSAGVDRVLVRGNMSGGEAGKLLQVALVDGDGDATDGSGAENSARRGQTPFTFEDNVLWYDVLDDNNWFWSAGDGLWIDTDGDSRFSAGVDRVLVRGSMSGGESGIRLSASAHHFGYDDGEVALNGRYDPGEDIYAANTYLAYDDMEVAFNSAYDPGEDIYDRDYIEIWVYAEGDAAQVPIDMYHPDLEPGLRDVGFRVHVNGIRIDDPGDDYDAPTGFQAAAGWGRSRGAAPSISAGGYNRHYEYKLTSAAADTPVHLVSNGTRVGLGPQNEEPGALLAPNAPRIWETDHKINWDTCEITWITHWKDLRRGNDNFQGFGSSSGQREESIFVDWLHPPPPPPPEPPIVVKEPLFGPIIVSPSALFVENYCWSIFVFNPNDQELGSIELRDHLPNGWSGGAWVLAHQPAGIQVKITDGPDGPVIQFPDGLPAWGWVEIVVCAGGEVAPSAEEVINRVEGDVDHDGDPDTPPEPVSGDSSGVPVVLEPEIELSKRPDRDEVEPGGSVTWRIGVANTGEVPVDDAELVDDVPEGLKPRTQAGTQPSGTDQTLPLGTLGRGDVHIFELETEVDASVAPSTTLTNTITLAGEFTTQLTGTRPYTRTISASIHITEPTECTVCITGQVTFEDCTVPPSQVPLGSVTVNIKRNGATVSTVETDEAGNYQYCLAVPPAPTDNYSAEVVLQEGSDKFRVRNGDGGVVPQAETPQFDLPVCPPNPRIVDRDVDFTDVANNSNVPDARRQALAAIFKETETAADFWETQHGVNLPAGGPDVVAFSGEDTSYNANTIYIANADSACTSTNRPMNREWHEFNHYVDDIVVPIPPLNEGDPADPADDDENWGGSGNSESSDSRAEGWAQFWSNKTKRAQGQNNPEEYEWSGGIINMEANYTAQGANDTDEIDAISSLLWDLHDSAQDDARVRTVVTNTNPPPPATTLVITYTDSLDITNQRIYEIISGTVDLKGMYDALVAAAIGQNDSDGDGINDLDELFIMHGFWGDDGDHVYEPHHGDDAVGWAGRDNRRDRPVPPGATMVFTVTLPGGATVPTTTLHADVAFDPPDGHLDFGYTHPLWAGSGDVEPFVPPPTIYTTTVEMWVTHGVSETDHLLFGNIPYWEQVASGAPHALTHTFCLGGDPNDVNCDGALDIRDVIEVQRYWRTAFPDLDFRPRYDRDGDGDVDIVDIMRVVVGVFQ